MFSVQKKSVFMLLSMLVSLSTMDGSYQPKVLSAPLEEKALGNVYLSMTGGKILMQGPLARKFGWIVQNLSDHSGLRREKPLTVPIPKAAMEGIRNCLNAIIEDPTHERLQFEVLSDLNLKDFADLLIYSWFLQVSDLVLVAAPEFVNRLKTEHLDTFAEQANFLDTILSADGKPEGVPWNECIAQLKTWLACFVLLPEDRNSLRARFIISMGLEGLPKHAVCGLMGAYIAVSGEDERDGGEVVGFCELIEPESIGVPEHIFRTELPTIASSFSLAPLMVIADCTSVSVADVITGVMKRLAIKDALGQDPVFNCLAMSPDLKTIALSVLEGAVLIDIERNSAKSLIVPDQKTAVFEGFLHFVPNSPVLLDIRTSVDAHFVRLWHTKTGKILLEKDFHGAPITAYCCTEEGIVWMMSSNGVLTCFNSNLTDEAKLRGVTCDKIWDPRERERAFTLWQKDVRALCFHPTGTRLVLAHNGGIATIIDTGEDCKQIARLASDETMLLTQGCYGKDHLLATLDRGGVVNLWHGENGHKLVRLQEGVDRLFWFAPDNSYLLTATANDAHFCYYSNKAIDQYLEGGLTLEQGLLLLKWLNLEAQGETIPNKYAHLAAIKQSFDKGKVGRFLGFTVSCYKTLSEYKYDKKYNTIRNNDDE